MKQILPWLWQPPRHTGVVTCIFHGHISTLLCLFLPPECHQGKEVLIDLVAALHGLPNLERINCTALAPLNPISKDLSVLDLSTNPLGPFAGSLVLQLVASSPAPALASLKALNLTSSSMGQPGAASLAASGKPLSQLKVCDHASLFHYML